MKPAWPEAHRVGLAELEVHPHTGPMSHGLDLVVTLTEAFTAALIFGLLTQRLRLSPIVGYLFAGIAVGPFTPGLVVHPGLAAELAEVGVILLLFGVGLHFRVGDLLAVRRIAIPGALAQMAVATLLGVLVTRGFGWTVGAGVVFGMAIAVASTVVLLRVLADHDALHTRSGHVAVGWLLVEDLFTVIVLVLMPVFAGPGHAQRSLLGIVGSVALALLKVAALIAFAGLVGRRVLPALLGHVAKTRSRELFTLLVLVIALGIAVVAAEGFGASMALGAFLAGVVVGQSRFNARAASEAMPMRDAFSVLFFVSIGMLFNPAELMQNAGITAATLAVVLVGKPLTALVVVLALRSPPRMAVTVALALAQIGEFSFILASLGRSLGVLPDGAMQALGVASIVSITLNPLLFGLVEPIARRLSAARPPDLEAPQRTPSDDRDRAIVVGCGPVGQMLARLLIEAGMAPTIIDLNHETVGTLQEAGLPAVYGDASQPAILEHAGIHEAKALLFAAPGSPTNAVQTAKDLNPKLVILARATYNDEIGALRDAGADVVVSEEEEVGVAMAERLLQHLGARGEKLDGARERARARMAPTA